MSAVAFCRAHVDNGLPEGRLFLSRDSNYGWRGHDELWAESPVGLGIALLSNRAGGTRRGHRSPSAWAHGSWYEARTSGQGFLLEVFPDLFSPGKGFVHGSWFTYDNVVGGAEHQRWYSLSGPVVSGQTDVSMTIHQNTGGNFNAPPITTAHPVGTATLSFDTCTSGQLVYNFTDGSGRASTIPLTRLTPNVTCSDASERPWDFSFTFSGHWYDPAMPGQGITMELNRVSRMVFLGWQTYAPSGAGAGPAGQRWYTGQGVCQAHYSRARAAFRSHCNSTKPQGVCSTTLRLSRPRWW